MIRRRVVTVVLGACVLAVTQAAPAAVTPVARDGVGARALADAISSQPGLVTGASYVAVPTFGTPNGVVTEPLGSYLGFPTAGTTFALLTTGNAELAQNPNVAPDSEANAGGELVRGDTAVDGTILRVDLDVPVGADCLAFQYRFFTEEFPEYLGQEYNDAFVAELDASTWTTNDLEIVAPANLARDAGGRVISVNAAGLASVSAENAAGTTYDGGTETLVAARQVTPGTHTLYLSIFDQVDPFFDSAVFVDNVRAFKAADPASCRSGTTYPATATVTPPPPPPAPDPGPPPSGGAVELDSFFAFDMGYLGGVRVAAGDVTGDGRDDIVVASGPGQAPFVRVFDGVTNAQLLEFVAFDLGFGGGMYIAAGDVSGDARAEIIVAPAAGGDPEVRIFDGVTGMLLKSFYAYEAIYKMGVRVAAGDVTGDGKDDIVTGAGAGGGPHVQVFDGVSGRLVHSFMAYEPIYKMGIYVAAGDVNGDGRADVVTGAGAGGGPHIQVYDGVDLDPIHSFMAYAPIYAMGVRVAASDIDGDGDDDVITGAGPGGGPHVQVFDGGTGTAIRSFLVYAPTAAMGIFVGAGDVDGDGRSEVVSGADAGGGPHIKVYRVSGS